MKDEVRNNIVRNVNTYKDLVKRGVKKDAATVRKFLAARVGTTIIQSCEVFGFVVYDFNKE